MELITDKTTDIIMSIEVIVNLDRKNAIFLMGESFVVEVLAEIIYSTNEMVI